MDFCLYPKTVFVVPSFKFSGDFPPFRQSTVPPFNHSTIPVNDVYVTPSFCSRQYPCKCNRLSKHFVTINLKCTVDFAHPSEVNLERNRGKDCLLWLNTLHLSILELYYVKRYVDNSILLQLGGIQLLFSSLFSRTS